MRQQEREEEQRQTRAEEAMRFWQEAPDQAKKDASKAVQWMADHGGFGVSNKGSGRKKVQDWYKKDRFLARDAGGPLLPGPTMPQVGAS